ncbi:MAG: tandem-95 repeat protein, partial [Proteobacteria bacterium]|nr:tandem-95 repeat protein [Pseudomonadota bacterium]
LTVTANTSPLNGTVTVAASGAFTYTPNGDFSGSDSFDYTIGDGNGGTASAAVTITINPVNDAPVATANAYTTEQNTRVIGNFLTGGIPDSDAEGDSLTIVGTTRPTSGRMRFREDGKFLYRPNEDFVGIDSFDYTISDGNGGTATATVTITVTVTVTVTVTANPANNVPVATANSYTTAQGTVLTGNVLTDEAPDSDADGDVLTMVGKTNPPSGWLFGRENGRFYYVPNFGFTGVDSFDYTISDGNGGVDTATVTITVNPG